MLLQQHDPSWSSNFQTIKNEISKALSLLNVSVEHVGSTAVPELAAKSIIDIDVMYDEIADFNEVKAGLETIGYFHNGDQGIQGREVFKRSATTSQHEVLDTIPHHLYVCRADSEELERHILFRDYLIANEEARMQYQQLKYAIAAEAGQDRKQYAQLKEIKAREFINEIIEKAQKEKYA